MRLADMFLRRGHLSEQALAEAWMTGDRPSHMDQCALCAERAVGMSRWLEEVQAVGLADADAAFPEARLAAQQSQILSRLEQLDRPARVISFPAQVRPAIDLSGHRRIGPAWLGAAAAAGLVIGMVSIEMTHRFWNSGRPETVPTQVVQPTTPASIPSSTVESMGPDEAIDGPMLSNPMNDMTPRSPELVLASYRVR